MGWRTEKKADKRFNEERHLNSGEFSYGEFSYYCRLENGTRENPTIGTLNRYAEALGRRSAFRVIDLGASATGWMESGIARGND